MFTGLIEAVGEVAEIKPTPAGLRIRIDAPLAADFTAGASRRLPRVTETS